MTASLRSSQEIHLLPDETAPADSVMTRRHRPRPAKYKRYRDCLRWEFGFTCVFCLSHESDLAIHPDASGTGSVTIEHYVLKGTPEGKALRDTYTNCFIACKQCNDARGGRPHDDPEAGRRLLNPMRGVWSEHFVLEDHHLRAVDDGCPSAAYTLEAYRPNAGPKVFRRRFRAQQMGLLRAEIQRADAEYEAIAVEIAKPARTETDRARADWLREKRFELRRAKELARELMRRHAAIPTGSQRDCRCADAELCTLPHWLEVQTVPWSPS